jgi:hypothetical protein
VREGERDSIIWHTLISQREIRGIRSPLGRDSQSSLETEVEDREAPTISEMSIPVSETRYWVAVTGASLSHAPIVLEFYDEYIETVDR